MKEGGLTCKEEGGEEGEAAKVKPMSVHVLQWSHSVTDNGLMGSLHSISPLVKG